MCNWEEVIFSRFSPIATLWGPSGAWQELVLGSGLTSEKEWAEYQYRSRRNDYGICVTCIPVFWWFLFEPICAVSNANKGQKNVRPHWRYQVCSTRKMRLKKSSPDLRADDALLKPPHWFRTEARISASETWATFLATRMQAKWLKPYKIGYFMKLKNRLRIRRRTGAYELIASPIFGNSFFSKRSQVTSNSLCSPC